jgi:hypothetical protein
VNILISSPDHIGTSVPVMLAWLILDRTEARWYIPAITGALLGWAQVADMLVLYVGVLPLVLVSAINVFRAVAIDRKPLASQRHAIALAAAALAGAAAAVLALHIIHARGGFYAPAPQAQIAHGATLARNLGIAGQGLLLLGGADFLGLPLTAGTAFTVLHLAGVALAAWGICLAAWRFGRDRDLVAQLLVTGIVINLGIYVLSTKANVVTQTREIAVVLPFSAALAGRVLAARLRPARLMVPVLAVVLLGYLAGLGYEISQPPAPPQDQRLTSWLEHRHLHTGLSGYWEANIVTLTSGDRVQVRTVSSSGGRLAPVLRESKAQWYDPGLASASFVVLFPGVDGYPGFTQERAALATFGKPDRTYHVGPYTILVWNRNLLRRW